MTIEKLSVTDDTAQKPRVGKPRNIPSSPYLRMLQANVEKVGLTYADIAKKMGYSEQVVSRIMNDRMKIPIDAIEKFCGILEISPVRVFRHVSAQSIKLYEKLYAKERCTPNEQQLIKLFREATNNTDPTLDELDIAKIKRCFDEVFAREVESEESYHKSFSLRKHIKKE